MAARTEVTNARADVEAGGIVSLVVYVKLSPNLQFTRQAALSLKLRPNPARARPRRQFFRIVDASRPWRDSVDTERGWAPVGPQPDQAGTRRFLHAL